MFTSPIRMNRLKTASCLLFSFLLFSFSCFSLVDYCGFLFLCSIKTWETAKFSMKYLINLTDSYFSWELRNVPDEKVQVLLSLMTNVIA